MGIAKVEINPASEVSKTDYMAAPVRRAEHLEDMFTMLIEQQAAKIPSSIFLISGLGAMFASLAFELGGNTRVSRFVGLWPPVLLVMGLYNKLVKTYGIR